MNTKDFKRKLTAVFSTLSGLGFISMDDGRPEEAILHFKRAIRVNPLDPSMEKDKSVKERYLENLRKAGLK